MRVIAALAMVMIAVPAAAQTMCVKPAVPACMLDNTTFVAAERMSDCQSAVRDYIDRTMSYVTCLNTEVTNTGRELNLNVNRFNCHLAGRNNCD